MYAVIEDGSRQYKVSEGEVVKVDYRAGEVGSRVEFPRVLLYQSGDDTRIGTPVVEGMRVLAEVVGHPSTKLYIQHFRRRKNYRRLRGHRQPYTSVRIRHILLPGTEPPPPPQPAPPPTETGSGTPPPPPAAGETPAPPGPGTPQTPAS
jgi:large subunit ribosomal protein L21